MDAAEADGDVKLYKASAELLLELRAKVPRLVTSSINGRYRRWVFDSKTAEVTKLVRLVALDSFQEWPQLLDPHLATLIQVLVDAYLSYCLSHSYDYLEEHDVEDHVSPLPRAVARVLYAFCKVRGYKIIIRLFNNEPRYIEPLLSCFDMWASSPKLDNERGSQSMTWEERYIHLLWLSHLMLAPFELSTISSLTFVGQGGPSAMDKIYDGLPSVAVSLIAIGLKHLQTSSTARDAASILLIRLAMRSDMQAFNLQHKLVQWASRELISTSPKSDVQIYRPIGLLTLLFGMVNSAPVSESLCYINDTFTLAHMAAISPEKQYETIRDFAPARKLIVKIMRSSVISAVTADETGYHIKQDLDLSSMMENCIQCLLDLLADNDTPVRQAASKAISQICLKLDTELSAQIVEAVLDSFTENVLLEDPLEGKLFPITDVSRSASTRYKKNVNAVDPLKWHGCMLTMGHLLFRKSLPISMLTSTVETLIMGLNFEQRSNVGTSIGVGVRDAACFGLWSLARKYTGTELNEVSLATISLPAVPSAPFEMTEVTNLQLIATQLAISACLDPSGNLRRGSSAALQELIGRHPDAVIKGIAIVQTIDYHAVARRSRAMTKVTVAASKLDECYHTSLLYALLGWRGARASDADSRRQAACAVGLLIDTAAQSAIVPFLQELVLQLHQLKTSNSGSNGAARHGLILTCADVISSIARGSKSLLTMELVDNVKPLILDINSVVGDLRGRITTELENVFEAASNFISASVKFVLELRRYNAESFSPDWVGEWIYSLASLLERCTISSDKDYVSIAAAEANIGVMALLDTTSQNKLIMDWLDPSQKATTNFTCKGRIVTLGSTFRLFESHPHLSMTAAQITTYLHDILASGYSIETKVNAMHGVCIILSAKDYRSRIISDSNLLVDAINLGLKDYTMDQRGDIGSLLRLKSIEAAQHLIEWDLDNEQKQQILHLLIKLSAEKLVKVRYHAWRCLEMFLKQDSVTIPSYNHQADVSSYEYFRSVAEFGHMPHYSLATISGFISSMAGGTEDISRTSSEALMAFLHDHGAPSNAPVLNALVESIERCINDVAGDEDREVIPMIDFLTLFINGFLIHQDHASSQTWCKQIWEASKASLFPQGSIMRTEAIVRCYAAWSSLAPYRAMVLDKLTRLLLHRWPKVRGAAADALFVCTGSQALVYSDWNALAPQNKAVVVSLRKELRIAG